MAVSLEHGQTMLVLMALVNRRTCKSSAERSNYNPPADVASVATMVINKNGVGLPYLKRIIPIVSSLIGCNPSMIDYARQGVFL